MSVKEVLQEQISACGDQNTWFVSLLNAIKGISEEQANWKPDEASNSIFELINHLIYYNHRYLNRLKDIPITEGEESSTFSNRKGLSWGEVSAQITEIMTEWKQVIEDSTEKHLDKWASDLAHLTLHTSYHTGQILYIRKLQGSWNPKNGVQG